VTVEGMTALEPTLKLPAEKISVVETVVASSEIDELMIEFVPFALGNRLLVSEVEVVLPAPAGLEKAHCVPVQLR
jgi:hypothetical protein